MSYVHRQEAIAALEAMKAETPLPVFAWSSELQGIQLEAINIGNQTISVPVSKRVIISKYQCHFHVMSNRVQLQDVKVLESMSKYVGNPRDWQMGEWRLEEPEEISFTPLDFLETTIPELVSSALQHFRESGVPVEVKFSHITLFQDSEESSNADYNDNELTEERGNKTRLLWI